MNLQEKLNQEGLRLTHPRQVVMSILESATVPLTPQTIYQRSLEEHEDIGLVTVYRTLDLLIELSLVSRVHGPDTCVGYALSSPGHHHHLVCRKCDSVIEFSGTNALDAFIEQVEQQTNFIIEGHLLQLYGLCPKCQKKKEKHEK
ncbi:MAG: Fur family transcriptional regulator [Chloroflexota bacterium]|jgi:Fe2+ or Zn2+ uptake regulation protein|nr:Fur family transcriptional regulator [Chloroflexota bacterium]